MKTKIKGSSLLLSVILIAFAMASECKAYSDTSDKSNKYTADFHYLGVGYQILSETEKTVAVFQDFDIDSEGSSDSYGKPNKITYVGKNGFSCTSGLESQVVEIPETVFDDKGIPYTVKAIADGSINYINIGMLILPESLEQMNGGVLDLPIIENISLPSNLKEIDGIAYCPRLKSLYIPRNLECIKDRSLSLCGFKFIYLPPSVKTLGDRVLADCDSLEFASIAGVEKMGANCLSTCDKLWWALLPESLQSMGSGCFNDCESLKIVSLPWSEIKMDGCFNGCPSIDEIDILAPEPYPFPQNSFLNVDRSNCSLYVPQGSLEKYKAADGWKEFYKIKEIPEWATGTLLSVNAEHRFNVEGGIGVLKIINPEGIRFDVFDIDGKRISGIVKPGIFEKEVPTGIYIVTTPYGSKKISVR